jgi:polysaccharide export outer membrane protein
MLKKLYLGAAMVTALFLLIACGASQKNHLQRIILQGIDTATIQSDIYPEQVIRKGDLLTILIYSDNKEATEIYNQPQGAGATAGAAGGNLGTLSIMGRGYLVDANGEIYLQTLGAVKAEGLTKKQLAGLVKEKLSPYLQNPYAIVRFANNRVTILGEVLKPGIIELPDQKLSILDAIGFAGDMTQFGRRDNVLIVREVNGKRTTGRLDLRSPSIYTSEYFYLQQNDMVYIEPSKKKPTGNEQVLMRNITIGTSVVSVVALIITLISR